MQMLVAIAKAVADYNREVAAMEGDRNYTRQVEGDFHAVFVDADRGRAVEMRLENHQRARRVVFTRHTYSRTAPDVQNARRAYPYAL